MMEQKAEIKDAFCQATIKRIARSSASRGTTSAYIAKTCAIDSRKWCAHVTPAHGAIHDCLVEHFDDLSIEW